MRYFRIYDPNPNEKPGAFEIKKSELGYWNSLKWGLFWVINDFKGERRVKAGLSKINAVYADLDANSKSEQMNLIKKGLTPTYVVETKRGFQCYWKVEDMTTDNWAKVMNRLIDFYQADANAKDVLRLLRVPGYKHWKDPNNPFLVKERFKTNYSYKTKDFLFYYPESKKEKYLKSIPKRTSKANGEDFFENVYNLDCVDALSKLSGSRYVGGETFSFHPHNDGTFQIVVNGKPTSCWVDANGHIGSYDNGGPSVWNWLRWYGNSDKEIYKIITEYFPEIKKEKW